MATIAIYKNVRIVIYSRDHQPPHVHAIAPDAEAMFTIDDLKLVRLRGFDAKAVSQIRNFLAQRKAELREAWREIHG